MIRQPVSVGGGAEVNGFVVENGSSYFPITISMAINGFPAIFMATDITLKAVGTNINLTLDGPVIPASASGIGQFTLRLEGVQWHKKT